MEAGRRRRSGSRGRQTEAAENDHLVLEATRTLVATRGADVSVAAIAEVAGVGVGTLYRRYSTKEALLQHLCVAAMDQVIEAAKQGLDNEDPWGGLVSYVESCVNHRTGVLAPLAGTIEVSPEMMRTAQRSADITERLVDRARRAPGALRRDVASLDISLLIEVLSRRTINMPTEEDENARRRLLAVALEGLRAKPGLTALPGRAPDRKRYERRWLTDSSTQAK